MTEKEFTAQLPVIANNTLAVKPPVMFNGLSARVFPLRASLETLQQVCNGYLNLVPPEAGYFRATLPYVMLLVLDYGQISQAVMRSGWFSQMEVFFCVPVEWYKRVGGRWVFHDWAVITPYIFVDDDFSVPLGRTVYGFPKILASVNSTRSAWMNDPLAPTTLARVETQVFPEAYSGVGIETRVFLEIEKAAVSNLRVPFDPASPMMPWTIASNMANAMGGFGRDAMGMAQAMRIFPIGPWADPRLFQEMLAGTIPWFSPGGKGFVQNSLNLKQFRRAHDVTQICYQALTNGQMTITQFNSGGLLGENQILLGDLSGGHSIKLYEQSSLPIARTLGLEVHRSWSGSDGEAIELKPVMPLWFNVDMKYSAGANIAWRTDDGIWKDGAAKPFDPAQKPAKETEAPDFNSTVATAIEAIAGPFQFTGTTIRVIPLLADKRKLQAFLKFTLNDPLSSPIVREDGEGEEQVEFEVWARPPRSVNTGSPIGGDYAYVYLTASSFSGVTSKTDNVGDWAQFELAFMIPVKWKRKGKDGRWDVAGVGLVPAFTFFDNCIATISRFEVQGIAALTAKFVRPESVWLSEEGQVDPKQTLLRVDTEVFSALGAGIKATTQPLIEISRDDTDAGLGDAPDSPWKWAEELRLELGTKKGTKIRYFRDMKVARALAIELLGNQTPICLYTLKQFRDVADPDRACYQSLVRVPRVLTEVFDVREIENTLTVRIHDYPSLNIVEVLGIRAARLEDSSSGIVYSAQGIRPFYIRATVDEPVAERLLARSGTTQWTLYSEAFDTLLSDDDSKDNQNAPRIMVTRKTETLQDQLDPSRTTENMYKTRQQWKANQAPADEVITAKQARDALKVADPQIVIESILSREWSNHDPEARWQRGRRDLQKAFSSLPEGGATKPYAEAELYRRINNMLATAPGAVAAIVSLEEMQKQAGNGSSTEGQPSDANAGSERSDEIRQLLSDEIRQFYEDHWGQGAVIRWRDEMEKIIANQSKFTALRDTMERSVNILSSVAILGLRGVQQAYEALNQALEKQVPPGQPLNIPTAAEVFEAGRKLLQSIVAIQGLAVVGEPSTNNNLDTLAGANYSRLIELTKVLQSEFQDEMKPGDSPEAILEVARTHGEEFRQLVDLARKYCELQYEALLNKMSRAYQKPDFCVRRDAVGAESDRLLPRTLSWDADWYYGTNMALLFQPLDPTPLMPTGAPGETPPSPAGSPQEAGS